MPRYTNKEINEKKTRMSPKRNKDTGFFYVYPFGCKIQAHINTLSGEGSRKKKKMFKKGEERKAAKWVDIQLMRCGREPVNILKRIK